MTAMIAICASLPISVGLCCFITWMARSHQSPHERVSRIIREDQGE